MLPNGLFGRSLRLRIQGRVDLEPGSSGSPFVDSKVFFEPELDLAGKVGSLSRFLRVWEEANFLRPRPCGFGL